MENIYLIFFFIIGLFMGSFYHVVGYRLPRGLKLTKPKRSYCPSCNHLLGFLDLIPVFSYLFLKGRCHYCHKKISIFYPIIEIVTGILFAVSFKLFGFSYELIPALVLSSMLSIILVSDIEYLIIPDSVTVVSMFILIISSLIFRGLNDTLLSIMFAVIIFTMMYLLMLFGNFLFKKESLGGADIKIMMVSGYILGFFNSILVLFIASVIALPISIFLLIINKEKMIPFGPFLMISMIIVFFLKLDVISFLMS